VCKHSIDIVVSVKAASVLLVDISRKWVSTCAPVRLGVLLHR